MRLRRDLPLAALAVLLAGLVAPARAVAPAPAGLDITLHAQDPESEAADEESIEAEDPAEEGAVGELEQPPETVEAEEEEATDEAAAAEEPELAQSEADGPAEGDDADAETSSDESASSEVATTEAPGAEAAEGPPAAPGPQPTSEPAAPTPITPTSRMAESTDDREDTTIYKVVRNHEEQYSIWPADRENALGWTDVGKQGTKQECLDYIKQVWTDMRPLSMRKKMEAAAEGEQAKQRRR